MPRTTRVLVDLSCGCTRRMPRGTAFQRMKDQRPKQCDAHDEATVKAVQEPPNGALGSLLNF